MSKRNDAEALDRLGVVANQYRALAATADELRARRDFLIVACYRRGIPLRQIAKAAGVHYTRVQQLGRDASKVADAAHLKPRGAKGTKGARS